MDDETVDEIFDTVQFKVVYHDYFATGKVPLIGVSVVGHSFLDYTVSWK